MAQEFLPPDPHADQQAPQPAARPVFLPPTTPPREDKRATLPLALGIGGLGALFFTGGTLFLVTLPASVAGWVLGSRARRAGAEQAVLAVTIGIVGVVFGVIAAVVWIVLAALGEA